MAYEGWMIKIGTWTVPIEYIRGDSYKVSPSKETLDDWPDYNNNRHIYYALGTQTTIEFETMDEPNLLDDEQIAKIRTNLNAARYSGSGLNKDIYIVNYYNPETGTYEQGDFTLDNITYEVAGFCEDNVFYRPIKFKFTEASPYEL